MIYPTISIGIATFNSEKTLKKTLDSLAKQTYPQSKIEILILDGNSTDNTLQIAKKYHCRIIQNPKVELVFAKQLAFVKAKGKYLLFLDSDEILENKNSLTQKYNIFLSDPRIKAVILGGYKTPQNSSEINYYINDFGDPFTFFVYKDSKSDIYLVKDWKKKYKNILVSDTKKSLIFNFSKRRQLPQIELWAGGNMIDLDYCRQTFPQIIKTPGLLAHLFYFITEKKKFTGISKNDYTIHNSVPSIEKYLKKISSRVKNNIFMTTMGVAGFSGRNTIKSSQYTIKRYLFIFYSFSIILPLLDSIYLILSRKKWVYGLHIFFCLYTALLILYYFSLKFIGVYPEMKTYGN